MTQSAKFTAHDALCAALQTLPQKPSDTANSAVKKAYSEKMSQVIAQAVAQSLRDLGLRETRPAPPGILDSSGAERRMAGGIGDKKVDVTWATEEAGLLFAASVKCITSRDNKTKNFQKNFTNRRGDMLFEAVTLHRRFPYAVLAGLFFFDKDANTDGTARRRSTFENAHRGLRLFTGRDDPAGRDEQFEAFHIALVDATPFAATVTFHPAGSPEISCTLDEVLSRILPIIETRNPDAYELLNGNLRKQGR